MSFEVRLLSEDNDLQGICAQMQPDVWGADNEMSSYRPEDLGRFLDAGGIAFLALSEDRIAGIAICYRIVHPSGDDTLYVHELDTHPDFRRQGVGTAILNEAFALAEELGLVEVWLGADEDNEPAHSLYRKLGPSEVEPGTVYVYAPPWRGAN